jgi:hypothetical protein
MDFESKTDFFAKLPQNAGNTDKPYADIYVAESPVLMLSVIENSMMVGTVQEHPFFYSAVQKIEEIMTLINRPADCFQYHWSG